MNIAYQNKRIFDTPAAWLQGNLIPSPSRTGYFNLVLPNGLVFSMQPGGVYGTRPIGTDGPWEQCKRTGNTLSFITGANEIQGILIMEL